MVTRACCGSGVSCEPTSGTFKSCMPLKYHDSFVVLSADCAVSPCAADAFLKFEKSAWGQKLASRQHKTQLTDFERFLAVKTRSKKAAKTRKTLAKMKKDAGLAEA